MAHTNRTDAAQHTPPRLPPGLLRHICEDLGQLHEPSVLSFALASKSFYSLAKALLFRRLTFTVTTPGRLRRHTRRCTELLRRHQGFGHVRCLVLVGSRDAKFDFMGSSTDDDQDLKDERYNSEHEDQPGHEYLGWHFGPRPNADWRVNQQRLYGLPDDPDFAQLHGFPEYSDFARRAVPHNPYRMDTAWAPLAELIRLLPALADLIYDCPAQFQPCILQALHDKLPSHVTRLHLRTFELRMVEGHFVPDSHELALIASPCSHSVWLQKHVVIGVTQRYADIGPGRQVQALGQMMKTEGLAPNLREVHVRQINRFRIEPMYIRPQALLPAELVGASIKQQKVALRHLGLGGGTYHHGVTDAHIQRWNERAGLSVLQTLELTEIVDVRGLDVLLSMSFPALTALTFKCAEMPHPRYLDKVKRFIRSLARLESLRVMAWDWSVASFADPVTGDGGAPNSTLRNLWLDHSEDLPTSSATSASEITRLGTLYPSVDTLSISIRRSKGDSSEVARYQALGASFPRLRHLALTLELPPPTGPALVAIPADVHPMSVNYSPNPVFIHVAPWAKPPPDSPWEQQIPERWPYTNGHIAELMAGSAVDAKLARQVFAAVGGSRLETMMLRAVGGTVFPAQRPRMLRPQEDESFRRDVAPWREGLARQWVVDRVNPAGEVRVREIVGRAYSWEQRWRHGEVVLEVKAADALWECFRKVWPESREKSKGWFDDWESKPLAGMD